MKTPLRLSVLPFAMLASILSARTTELVIDQTVEPHFPATLAFTPIADGDAHVVVHIDADGKLLDCLVTGYTDKSFADEAVAALRAWRYTAPTQDGQSHGIRTEIRFHFEGHGRVVSLTADQTPNILLRQMGIYPGFVTNVCPLHELDRPLATLSAVSPANPSASADLAANQPHSVIIDFYVDETGQPRMPVVVNSVQEYYASAAMDALSRWRFTPPTRAGRPVAVRVRQKFVFQVRS